MLNKLDGIVSLVAPGAGSRAVTLPTGSVLTRSSHLCDKNEIIEATTIENLNTSLGILLA
jgi:hypothetical protein